VREHDRPSKVIPVVDLSSDEEEGLPNTTRDEFARRLFGELNHSLLGPPTDDNVIIVNDSDEEEEVCDEITANTKVSPPSIVNSPAQPSLPPTPMMHPMGCKMIIVMV
jgi:hypothetical protein